MYAQFLVLVFDSDTYFSFTNSWNLTLDNKIVLMVYGIFNLYFGYHANILPQYCLSKNLKFIHLAILSYISAFYPLLLILLTWVCVELHGRNFRPLVWLWQPFHRCFVRLWRGWYTKSDITDVFATFFCLSYKILYQTVLLISNKSVKHFNISGSYFITYFSTTITTSLLPNKKVQIMLIKVSYKLHCHNTYLRTKYTKVGWMMDKIWGTFLVSTSF